MPNNTVNTDAEASVKSSKKKLAVFWLRMLGWIGSSVVAPVTTFAIKFGLFNETGYQVTTDELGNVTGMNIALNGWGIISIILIILTISEIVNEIMKSQGSGYTYSKQMLTGLKSRVLPLVALLGIFYYLEGVMQQIQFCLIILLISQTAGVACNPLPKWRNEKLGVENYNDGISELIKLTKSIKRGDK